MDRSLQQYVDMDKWEQGKARARELVKESAEVEKRSSAVQWAWGDLCLEVVPEHGRSPGVNGAVVGALLDAWIDDYEYPYSRPTLNVHRATCRAWPKSKRVDASFSVHGLLSGHPDRFSIIAPGIGTTEARELAGHKRRKHIQAPSTAFERASAVKGWARSLGKLIDDKPSEDVVNAVADAWYAVTELVDRLGILDEMFAEYEEQAGELVAA